MEVPSNEHTTMRARDLYERGDLIGAALREADACDNDGYYITAKILRELVARVDEAYRGQRDSNIASIAFIVITLNN